MAFDLISIGDAVIDTYVPITDAHVHVDKNQRELCFRFGEKIPVGESIEMVAGNAANNVVGASRLGLKAAIYVNIGSDEDGLKFKKKFQQEKVDIRYLQVNKDMPSNHNIVLNYQGERTILIFHQPWKYQLPELERSKWVYFTSLSPTYVDSSILDDLKRYLERTGAKMMFNPGTFQIKMGIKHLAKVLSLAEVLIVNKEEAKVLLEIPAEQNPQTKVLPKELIKYGPRAVIVTNGGKGSYGFDGEHTYKLETFPSKLKEMTGAGDSYAVGVLAGLFYGNTLDEAMRWGACNSASVVEYVGPQDGLLTLEQMKKRLKQYEKVAAQKV